LRPLEMSAPEPAVTNLADAVMDYCHQCVKCIVGITDPARVGAQCGAEWPCEVIDAAALVLHLVLRFHRGDGLIEVRGAKADDPVKVFYWLIPLSPMRGPQASAKLWSSSDPPRLRGMA
jgi:hypothetical protein